MSTRRVLKKGDSEEKSTSVIRTIIPAKPSKNNKDLEIAIAPMKKVKKGKQVFYGDVRNIYEEAGMSSKAMKLPSPYHLVPDSVVCVAGRTGTGKTNLLVSLTRYLDNFDAYYIVSGTDPSKEFVYNYIKERLPDMTKFYPLSGFSDAVAEIESEEMQNYKVALILDDFMSAKGSQMKPYFDFATRSRKATKKGCCFILLTQNYVSIPVELRRQARYFILMPGFGRPEVKRIVENFACNDLTTDQIYKMYEIAVKADEKAGICNCFLIDKATDEDNLKFRRQFTGNFIINPEAKTDFKHIPMKPIISEEDSDEDEE